MRGACLVKDAWEMILPTIAITTVDSKNEATPIRTKSFENTS